MLRGEPLDQRTDVYGLGAIFYHLLCRQPPHTHTGDGAASIITQVLRGRSTRAARRSAGDVPSELESIVRKAMGRRPSDRHAGADELRYDEFGFLRDAVQAAR